MPTDTWYERSAWIFFALLSGMALPLAVLIAIDPSSASGLWAQFGHEVPATVAADPVATGYVHFISHWAATGTIGFNLFGLLIAVTAFRRGERWAWLTLSLAALAATRKRVWQPRVLEPATALPA